MTPIEEYRSTMQYLRRIFQLCGQDVFEANFRRGIVAYLSIALWTSVILMLLLTAFDKIHYNATTRFMATSIFFGTCQVILYLYLIQIAVI